MEARRLGSNGPEVSAIGLGCMGMSEFYGLSDRTAALATIDAAVEAIGWVASQRDDIVPLVGSRSPARLAEAVTAPLSLSPATRSAFERAVPRGAARGNREMIVSQ